MPTVDKPTASPLCTGISTTSNTLLPGVTLTNAEICDEIATVEYTLDDTEITSLVRSTTGACIQVVGLSNNTPMIGTHI